MLTRSARFDWCIIIPSRSQERGTCHTFVRRFPSKSEKQVITLTYLYTWTMEMQIKYTTVYCFFPAIENVFANWTHFFATCHELVDESNQHMYGSRALAGERTKNIYWLRWFETLVTIFKFQWWCVDKFMKPSPIPDISVFLYMRIIFAMCIWFMW